VRGGTTVRPATEDDLPALTRIYNHYVEHTVATFDVEPFTVAARQPWFEHYAGTGPHRLLVAQVDSQVAGYATSGPFRLKPAYARTVETTVYLDPTATGRGVGSLLYAELLDLVTADGMHRAYAGVALPNDASEALHRRLGFRDVGTFTEVGRKQDRWVDVRWYERALP
jgi:phosphinothricin acetyltransferase